MSVKLLTEHHLEFLSLKDDRTGSSESTLVKIPHCWKSHVRAQIYPALVRSVFSHFILEKNFIIKKTTKKTISLCLGDMLEYEPHREKTCLWGFRQSEIQSSLLRYRDQLEN